MGNPGASPPPSRPPPPPPLKDEKQYQKVQQRSTLNKPQSDLYPNEDDDYTTPQQFPPQPPPADHKPHSFPPQQDDDDYYTPVQQFPPPPEKHHHQQPHSFPPAQDEDELYTTVHQFPPPHPEVNNFSPAQPQAFRPPNIHHFQPSPNVMPPFQPPGQFPGGVTGHPVIQPSPAPAANLVGWKNDLFGCMNDPQNALVTALFPCVTFGQIAEIVDSGTTSCGTSGMLYGVIAFCIAIPCIMSCTYRTKLRNKFGLTESPGPDWVVHCFCECCALCQEYRELKDRGFDPSIGWLGNQAAMQQQRQFPMAAPMGQRMI